MASPSHSGFNSPPPPPGYPTQPPPPPGYPPPPPNYPGVAPMNPYGMPPPAGNFGAVSVVRDPRTLREGRAHAYFYIDLMLLIGVVIPCIIVMVVYLVHGLNVPFPLSIVYTGAALGIYITTAVIDAVFAFVLHAEKKQMLVLVWCGWQGLRMFADIILIVLFYVTVATKFEAGTHFNFDPGWSLILWTVTIVVSVGCTGTFIVLMLLYWNFMRKPVVEQPAPPMLLDEL